MCDILWLDIETTGLDPRRDGIIEVGAILTNSNLEEIHSYSSVVKPTLRQRRRLMKSDVVWGMHKKSGLLKEIFFGKDLLRIEEVDEELNFLLNLFGASERVVLAGSGVGHFDLQFVKQHMPILASRLEYYVIDVGVVRRFHRVALDSVPFDFVSKKEHRALSDARDALNEAIEYKKLYRIWSGDTI